MKNKIKIIAATMLFASIAQADSFIKLQPNSSVLLPGNTLTPTMIECTGKTSEIKYFCVGDNLKVLVNGEIQSGYSKTYDDKTCLDLATKANTK